MAENSETHDLIGSDKVEGTNVYGAGDEKVGSIERVMINKRSGKVSYAVLAFGGFLGMGHDHYPVPWASLTYDTNLGGYRTDISKQQLEGAPKYTNDTEWDWSDQARGRKVYEYYGTPWTMFGGQ
ncbi:MAG TPA: PRC-barrel domain-containing protein [Hyphomicrobium sp.]|nr:PRC-barrel domain-containing protein [Hyphomicrobium sp.]